MTLQEIFTANLKYFRKKKKMTQNELTLALNKGYNYINGIEQGKSFPQLEVIEQICEILEIKPADLFDENSCKKNIIKSNKEEIVQEVVERLHNLLKEDIRIELMKIMKDY